MRVHITLSKEIEDLDKGRDFYVKVKELLKDEVDCRIQGSISNQIAIEEI